MFGKKAVVAENKIAILCGSSGIKKLLPAGKHTVKDDETLTLFDLDTFPLKSQELENLWAHQRAQLEEHLAMVETAVDEVAMVCRGQKRYFLRPGNSAMFSKAETPLEILRCKIPSDLRVPPEWRAKMPAMHSQDIIKQVQVQTRQFALLLVNGEVQDMLPSGIHAYFELAEQGRYEVKLYSLDAFPASIENLDWLMQAYGPQMEPYLEIVKTAVDEVAMVCRAQQKFFVQPELTHAFWKKGGTLEILRTKLTSDLRVPETWLAKLIPGASLGCVKQVTVPANSFALLCTGEQFCDYLPPGNHAYFELREKQRLISLRESEVITSAQLIDTILDSGHALALQNLQPILANATQLVAIWHQHELVYVLASGGKVLAHRSLRTEIIELPQQTDSDLTQQRLHEHFVSILRSRPEAKRMLAPFVSSEVIPADHLGLVYLDQVLQQTLQPGFYAWWHAGKEMSVLKVDTRLTTMDISGQEMLTQDKVPLRVNVTAGYRIVDAQRMISQLNDYKDFIYKEIQFALRAAIGGRSLDGLLENKNQTDAQILSYMQEKCRDHGIEVVSTGIKDLILPGEIKAILGKVVEAEKAAQANVIRRREETAATRSLMNTSRVLEENPVALRLKELETLEKITEKIEHLSVYGGLEGLLQQLAGLKGKKAEE